MAAGFHRSTSISVPGHPTNTPVARPSKLHIPDKTSYHVRSTSLPCRHSHPVVSHVEDEVRALAVRYSHPDSPRSTTGLTAGLARLDLLTAVDDLRRLPHSFSSLRSSAAWTECLLDDFLRLADTHGTFRLAVVAMKQHQSEAQVATRRRDREGAGEARLRSPTHCELTAVVILGFSSEAKLSVELAETLTDAVTASLRICVRVHRYCFRYIGGVVVDSSSPSCPSSLRAAWMVGALRRLLSSLRRSVLKDEGDHDGVWRVKGLEGLAKMEECLASLESRSERVFRRLVNTRVSVLNILTPSF